MQPCKLWPPRSTFISQEISELAFKVPWGTKDIYARLTNMIQGLEDIHVILVDGSSSGKYP